MKHLITLGLFLLLLCSCKDKTFLIADGDTLANIVMAVDEWPGVARAAGDLCDDVERVTDRKSLLANQYQQGSIVAGTIGHSQIIDSL